MCVSTAAAAAASTECSNCVVSAVAQAERIHE